MGAICPNFQRLSDRQQRGGINRQTATNSLKQAHAAVRTHSAPANVPTQIIGCASGCTTQ
uniref:Uncharacterized protein n=1 Tax=Myoviridae sp. ct9MV2 TaxID=2826625 RepID=A0A8S5NDL4_9CAUD|nr:MAG TPA: hypothetical protein [Myoviridae sp. ct9MV2]